MSKLTKFLNYQKKIETMQQSILGVQQSMQQELESLMVDFDSNYYFEINIKSKEHPEDKFIWFSFYLPVINSLSVKKLIQVNFLTKIDILSDEMKMFDFTIKDHSAHKQTAFLMLLSPEIKNELISASEYFTQIGFNSQYVKQYLKSRYVNIKEEARLSSFSDFIIKMTQQHVMPFLKEKLFYDQPTLKQPKSEKIISEYEKHLSNFLRALEGEETLPNYMEEITQVNYPALKGEASVVFNPTDSFFSSCLAGRVSVTTPM